MLTKTLQFDDDVLSVLKNMRWNDDGTVGVIDQQLDRALYVKVNKALEAMKGKWDKKEKGHVFSTDPRESVEGLIERGTIVVEKDGFFRTPEAVVMKMLSICKMIKSPILEPSAGDGAIVKILLNRYPEALIYAIEKNKDRCLELSSLQTKNLVVKNADFLTYDFGIYSLMFGTILMNPPFEERQDIDHIYRAYSLLRDGGELVSVTSEGIWFSEDKKSIEFRKWTKFVNGRSTKLPEKSFASSGTSVNTRLFYVRKEDKNECKQL